MYACMCICMHACMRICVCIRVGMFAHETKDSSVQGCLCSNISSHLNALHMAARIASRHECISKADSCILNEGLQIVETGVDEDMR